MNQDTLSVFSVRNLVVTEEHWTRTFRKPGAKWLVGIFLLAVTVGILLGAIAAGRLHVRFPQ